MLADKEITDQIIGAAIQVHKTLGPGFLESVYEKALCLELDYLRVRYEVQKPVSILYRDQRVGEHRLDLLVEKKVVVELKAVKELDPVFFSIVRSYMKAVGVNTGILLNFASMPLTVKRVGREQLPVKGS